MTEREKELDRMAHRGECDGHDRAWHSQIAKTHHELVIMTAAANRAQKELQADEKSFKPTFSHRHSA